MLTPEDIESREFLVSLRGYDRDEVAAFLGRIAAEVRELREQLERARSQPPRPEPAPAAPVSAVPAVPAAPAASEIFGDVARETQRILEAAQEAAANLQRKARQEIDRELQQARSRAARHIADGERRREAIERVVSELESRRDALAEAFRSVGRTVDETLRELVPAPEPTASVREALLAEAAAASEAAAPAAAAPADDAAPVGEVVTSTTPDADGEADTDDAGAEAGPDADADAAEDSDAERADVEGAGGEDVDVEGAGAAEPPAPAVAGDVTPEDGATETAAQEDEAAADVGAADTTAPDAAVSATEAASASDTATGAGVPAAAEASAPGPAAAAAAASATAAAASPSAEARPDVAAAAETPAPEPAPVAAAPADEAIAPAEGDDQGKPRALRAQALSPLHPRLVRQVKRELQELQNVTLDALRRAGGQGKPEAFGPDDESYQQLGRAVEDLLRQAYTAGIGSAGTLVGRELDSPSRSRQLGGDFRREAAGRIDEAVAATLRVAMQAQEDLPGLSDRVGGVYTELKSTGAEELAASHLVRSYELGMLDTWAANGITHRRWILGREPRCPEGRCRHNDSAGVVALHDDFPSGHAAPPVHVGCTCTTIPITEPPA